MLLETDVQYCLWIVVGKIPCSFLLLLSNLRLCIWMKLQSSGYCGSHLCVHHMSLIFMTDIFCSWNLCLKRISYRLEPGCKQELFLKCWRWAWGQSSFHDLRLQCQAWVLEFVFLPVFMEDIISEKVFLSLNMASGFFFFPTRQHFFQQILIE